MRFVTSNTLNARRNQKHTNTKQDAKSRNEPISTQPHGRRGDIHGIPEKDGLQYVMPNRSAARSEKDCCSEQRDKRYHSSKKAETNPFPPNQREAGKIGRTVALNKETSVATRAKKQERTHFRLTNRTPAK
jgi:hypothetical protein